MFGKSKSRTPRAETSAEIQRRYTSACPGHTFTSGERIDSKTMRYWCPCGAFRDRRL